MALLQLSTMAQGWLSYLKPRDSVVVQYTSQNHLIYYVERDGKCVDGFISPECVAELALHGYLRQKTNIIKGTHYFAYTSKDTTHGQ